ncbi:hypothetical protein [Nitratireductor sp. XY-223]|uniref:hypothetical protein n=1 Tax=Nitratireductor sp. XY-223 TaxID=2561926 RepID=UPI0010AA730C|nr:hypothetical protein [Nitratireductor sp. XY-223]
MSEKKSKSGAILVVLGILLPGGLVVLLFTHFFPIEFVRGVRVECSVDSYQGPLILAVGEGEYLIRYNPRHRLDPNTGFDTKLVLTSVPPGNTDYPEFTYCAEFSKTDASNCKDASSWHASKNDGKLVEVAVARDTYHLVNLDAGVTLQGTVVRTVGDNNQRVEGTNGLAVDVTVSKKGLINYNPILRERCAALH